MSSEERAKADACTGTFSGCLVEGDADEKTREGKRRRRAIGISIVLQSAGLAALVIAPLFAKQAELPMRVSIAMGDFVRSAAPPRQSQTPPGRTSGTRCSFCVPPNIPPRIPTLGPERENDGGPISDSLFPSGPSAASSGESLVSNNLDGRAQPRRPEEPPHEKRPIHESHINPALLTRRVEPVYPFLAHQLRKSGKVELHAVIATDGSIQSLEVVSGDPLFVNSALEAVRQWRYKPTNLNGQPVEIDTFITVIYTLQ